MTLIINGCDVVMRTVMISTSGGDSNCLLVILSLTASKTPPPLEALYPYDTVTIGNYFIVKYIFGHPSLCDAQDAIIR